MHQPLNLRGLRLFPASIEHSLGEGFKGRAYDLWRLHHALWTMGVGAAALTGAIEAGGGYGKSRLATEYLHRYGPDHYKGGLFWIDAAAADDELKQDQAFHGILCTIEPANARPSRCCGIAGTTARDGLSALCNRLPTEQAVLFVIDNVPEPEARKPAASAIDLVSRARPRDGARNLADARPVSNGKHPGIEHRCARPLRPRSHFLL